MVVKCIVSCVNLLVGLFLSILQVTMKEREFSLLGILREIWDLCNKIYLDVKTKCLEDRCVNFPCPNYQC
jgi:hypothetical protein